MRSTAVVAAFAAVKLTAASTADITKAAYGGVWQGWLCPKKATDVKVAVDDISDTGATILYAAGNPNFGTYNETMGGGFSEDAALFSVQFMRGDYIVLGSRADGHLNIHWKHENRFCAGILRNIRPLPTE